MSAQPLPSPQERAIFEAVALMGTLPGFPFDDATKAAIMGELKKLCGNNPIGIVWLGRKVANSYPKWPGFLTVRAVWCSRYQPADGNEASLGCDDPVGAEIQKRAEIPGIEARAGKQITGGELRLLAGATTQLSIEDERFRAQSGRFAACCKKLPNLKKLRDGREFALSMDLERREELLKKFEQAAFAGEANAANPAAQVQSREGSEG